MVDEVVAFAVESECENKDDVTPLAINGLAVNLGEAINKFVPDVVVIVLAGGEAPRMFIVYFCQ